MDERANANTSLVIETMYRVAASPDAWRELVDALGEGGQLADPSPGVALDLARSLDIARLTVDPSQGLAPGGRADIGWILISGRHRVLSANSLAQSMMTDGFGKLETGAPLTFDDPANAEALTRAVAQSRAQAVGQTVLRLDRGAEDGPCFAYVASARALPGITGAQGLDPGQDQQAYALIFPAVEETSRLWSSIGASFGLTPAELRLARKLRDGRSLKEAAEELGVSFNTVRNQLRAVFDKMGLKRQGELIRALTQLAAVAGALEAQAPPPPPLAVTNAPPVERIILADGRRLAYRDYGDPAGRTVMVFHEGLGSSLLPPSAQHKTHDLGLRLICPERPGFGQSDPRLDYSFDGVADDMVELCDQLGLAEVHIAGILSGSPSAITTAIRLGRRAAGLLLCSGRPPRPVNAVRTRSIFTLFRARMESNPWVIETFYAILRLRLSPQMVSRMIRGSLSSSPSDAAYFEANPDMANYLAAAVSECLARSTRGAVDDIKAFRRASTLTVLGLNCPLTSWHGEEDVLAHVVAEILCNCQGGERDVAPGEAPQPGKRCDSAPGCPPPAPCHAGPSAAPCPGGVPGRFLGWQRPAPSRRIRRCRPARC